MARSTKAPAFGNFSEVFQGAIFPGNTQKVVTSATAGYSAAIGSGVTLLRVVAKAAAFITLGSSGTAVVAGSGFYLPANVPAFVGCQPGQFVSYIQDSGAGDLFITEAQVI